MNGADLPAPAGRKPVNASPRPLVDHRSGSRGRDAALSAATSLARPAGDPAIWDVSAHVLALGSADAWRTGSAPGSARVVAGAGDPCSCRRCCEVGVDHHVGEVGGAEPPVEVGFWMLKELRFPRGCALARPRVQLRIPASTIG